MKGASGVKGFSGVNGFSGANGVSGVNCLGEQLLDVQPHGRYQA